MPTAEKRRKKGLGPRKEMPPLTDAQRDLVADHWPIAMKIITGMMRKGTVRFREKDAAVEAAARGAMNAARTWNREKAKFSTYLWHAVVNTIRRDVIKGKEETMFMGGRAVQGDATDAQTIPSKMPLPDSAALQREQLRLIGEIAKDADEKYRGSGTALLLLAEGDTMADIARRDGVSHQAVQQRVAWGREFVQKRLKRINRNKAGEGLVCR